MSVDEGALSREAPPMADGPFLTPDSKHAGGRSLLMVNLVAYRALVSREINRIFRIWAQTLIPPVINAFLYMTIFGALIGPRIGNILEGQQVPYINFIIPGIVMMAVIVHSYSNVVSSFFSIKFHRSIEEITVAPVHPLTIMLGFITGGVIRGCTVGVIVTLASMLFTDIAITHLGLTFAVMVLTAVLFSTGGLINAIYANSFDEISLIPTFVLTPLTYLGGIFYSIELLPDFWRGLSLLNPVLYMINGLRYGYIGVSDIDVYRSLAIIALFCVIFAAVALTMLSRGTRFKS